MTDTNVVKQLIKFVITIGLFTTCVLLFQFEVLANYSVVDITQIRAFYSKFKNPATQPINCSYNCNFSDTWNLPLEIFNVTNNETLTIKNSTLSPYFTRIESHNYKYAIFCSTGYKPLGTGNALAIYWTSRAIAFFMNWTFVMNSNTNHITKSIDTSCQSKQEYHLFDREKYPRMKWSWFFRVDKQMMGATSSTFSSMMLCIFFYFCSFVVHKITYIY
eukprot:308003_1